MIFNTFKFFAIYALVDFSTTEVFVNKSFIKKYYLNIYKLFKAISVYNIDGISKKASQISEVVDIILYY